MTEADIQFLKENIDKTVDIQTTDGEQLTAKILFVSHDEEYDEHDVLYQVISSNMLDSYVHLENAGGYVLDFDKILSVKVTAGGPGLDSSAQPSEGGCPRSRF